VKFLLRKVRETNREVVSRTFLTSAHFLFIAGALIWADCASAESAWKTFSTPGGQIPAPLTLNSLAGKPVNLSAFKGEVVLVNFWATWCEPCRAEMPSLNRLHQRLGAKGFRVVAINIGDGAPQIKQFLKSTPLDFTIARDPDSVALKAWRVRILPASFLLDKNGLLRYQMIGDANWDEAAVQAPILELLK
jgi:cytochrome c biogenesis protein CcmG/thiol:disulfide interchange protein DsbE